MKQSFGLELGAYAVQVVVIHNPILGERPGQTVALVEGHEVLFEVRHQAV